MNTLKNLYRDFLVFFLAPSAWHDSEEEKSKVEMLEKENHDLRNQVKGLRQLNNNQADRINEQRAMILLQREALRQDTNYFDALRETIATLEKPREVVAYAVLRENKLTHAIFNEPGNCYLKSEVEEMKLTFRPLSYTNPE